VFHPFRSIGLYCDKTPFALQRQGNVHFAAVPTEKSFQLYNCDKLNVVLVGDQHPKKIRAIAMFKKLTFTATGNEIYVAHSAKKVATLSGHQGDVNCLLVFGDHLISTAEDKMLKIWDYRKGTLLDEIELADYTNPTCLMHPDTYLNKIVLGTREGQIQLWNVATKKLIYTFQGWGSPVTCIVQSPAVDVVAIGLADGRIMIHNLKLDKTLFTFKQEEGEITSLSFRTDGKNFLTSSSKAGHIAVWDLDKQKLSTIIRNAHHGAVVSAQFFELEPLLLTTGTDNSIKVWIFDQPDGSARILRSRTGHSGTPNKVKFFVTSSMIISAGSDRSLRIFSTVRERRSREFSQGHLASRAKKLHNLTEEDLKLPPFIDFDASVVKQREWDNVVTCHEGSSKAYSWRKEHFTLGKHVFFSKGPERGSPITAVAISSCGNFALIGSQSGWVDKYNLQSGMHRGSFGESAHDGAVQGLAVDLLNRILISASLDGTIKFWDFESHKLLKTVQIEAPVSKFQLNKESSLLAVVSDDGVIRVFDVDTQNLVRRFESHRADGATITDIALSGDARHLVSAGSDGSVRYWDLPSGRCIDWFKVSKPIVSMSLSPRADFLATSHVGSRGIYLWANAMYFTNIFLKPVPKIPKFADLPNLVGAVENAASNEEDRMDEDGEDEDLAAEFGLENSPSQLSDELITLSNEAATKYKTLVNLDLIRERNKPIKPAEAPQAPFLLGTIPGIEPKFVPTATSEDEENGSGSKILNLSAIRPKTKFIIALESASISGVYSEVMDLLKSMSPTAIDFEIRSLSLADNCKEVVMMLNFIKNQLVKRTNFELIQATLNVLLKVHVDAISSDDNLLKLTQEIESLQSNTWSNLEDLFHNNLCLINFFANIQS
jgi:U3 small nucleolar RNA-associated protein 21